MQKRNCIRAERAEDVFAAETGGDGWGMAVSMLARTEWPPDSACGPLGGFSGLGRAWRGRPVGVLTGLAPREAPLLWQTISETVS